MWENIIAILIFQYSWSTVSYDSQSLYWYIAINMYSRSLLCVGAYVSACVCYVCVCIGFWEFDYAIWYALWN